jgi:ProP effector
MTSEFKPTAPEGASTDHVSESNESPDTVEATPGSGASLVMTAQACEQTLRQLFPALFGREVKPLKLRIQADIQARAPGLFSRRVLSHFLHQFTGRTPYLLALTRLPSRYDLDGQPAGDVAAEHREAAATELLRRRMAHAERRAREEQGRRERQALLLAFESTSLTVANFCALKGLEEGQLEVLLTQARAERVESANASAAGDGGARPPRERREGAPKRGHGSGHAAQRARRAANAKA